VLCLEPLLHRLMSRVPLACYRAYADDIGAVFQDLPAAWPEVVKIFVRFSELSGLFINAAKTVVMPLWRVPRDPDRWDLPAEVLREAEWLANSAWPSVTLAFYAKYLGFFIGPGALPAHSYDPILAKLRSRLQLWKGFNLSLLTKFKVWNIYLSTLASYVEQLLSPDAGSHAAMLQLLKKHVGGAHAWCPPLGFGFFGAWFGFPCPPRLPELTNLAAQGRVWATLPGSRSVCTDAMRGSVGGLSWSQLYEAFPGSPLLHVWRARNTLTSWDLQPESVLSALSALAVGSKVKDPKKRARHILQSKLHSECLALCIKRNAMFSGEAIRTPLQLARPRWVASIGYPPARARVAVERWRRNCMAICRSVPPRVLAATIRAGLNGWDTLNRVRQDAHTRCWLCGNGLDSLKHLCVCPVVRRWFSMLGLPASSVEAGRDWLLLCTGMASSSQLALCALGTHAVYDLCNSLRHGACTRHTDVYYQLRRHVMLSCVGNSMATRLVRDALQFRGSSDSSAAPPG